MKLMPCRLKYFYRVSFQHNHRVFVYFSVLKVTFLDEKVLDQLQESIKSMNIKKRELVTKNNITFAPGNVVSRSRPLIASYSNPRRIVLPSVNSK